MPPLPRARARVALASHRRAFLLILAIAVLLAVVVPAAVQAVADERADDEARRTVAALDVAQRGLRITTSSADDPGAQQAAATAALVAAMGHVDVVTARLTYPVEARPSDGSGPTPAVVLQHVAKWADRVDIVDGRAPRGGGDAVEVVAPRAAGLATGQRFLLGSAGVPVEVVGLWEPRDPAAAVWFADPGLGTGTMSERLSPIGPLFTADDAGVDRVADTPLVRWTVVPSVGALTSDGLARLARGMEGAKDALTAAGVIVQGATVEGTGAHNLAAAAAAGRDALDRARDALVVGVGAAAIALLAAAGAFELGTRGERETVLARGAQRWRLPAREAPAVVPAAVLSGLAGWGVAALVGGDVAPTIAVAAVSLGVVGTLLVMLRRLPLDARPARQPAIVLVAVLAVATALAVWRLLRGSDEPDAAARSAPLLLLVCAGLVAGLVVRRLWLPGIAAALAGGAGAYAVLADSAAVRAAWVVAAGGALVVGAAVILATGVARRHRGVPAGATARIPPPARRSPARYAVSAVLACGLGVVVAIATAGPVLGLAS